MYTVNTLDGVKRRAVYGKSKKGVRLKLTEAIADRDKGLVFNSGNLSVGEYLDRWLEATQGAVGELTWKRHEPIVRLHIAPAIGAIKLAALTPLQVGSLNRAKSKSHLAPGSAKRIHTTLHKSLRQAVRWQMIPRNPCDSVDAPKGYRGEIRPLDKELARVLLDIAIRTQPARRAKGAPPRSGPWRVCTRRKSARGLRRLCPYPRRPSSAWSETKSRKPSPSGAASRRFARRAWASKPSRF